MSWLQRISSGIDKLNERVGHAMSWVSLLVVVVVAWNVLLRYLFHKGSVAMQELEWHLFGPLFILTAGYTLLCDEHVRVDIFYSRVSAKGKAVVDLIGSLCFLIPVSLLVIWTSYSFVAASWAAGEGSPDPGGLPARYILKAVMPVGFALLALQAVSMAIHSLCRVLGLEGAEVRTSEETVRGS
jgi:TRAP-type mannitol/chloroaromatic compound transport system permease small subunit